MSFEHMTPEKLITQVINVVGWVGPFCVQESSEIALNIN